MHNLVTSVHLGQSFFAQKPKSVRESASYNYFFRASKLEFSAHQFTQLANKGQKLTKTRPRKMLEAANAKMETQMERLQPQKCNEAKETKLHLVVSILDLLL